MLSHIGRKRCSHRRVWYRKTAECIARYNKNRPLILWPFNCILTKEWHEAMEILVSAFEVCNDLY